MWKLTRPLSTDEYTMSHFGIDYSSGGLFVDTNEFKADVDYGNGIYFYASLKHLLRFNHSMFDKDMIIWDVEIPEDAEVKQYRYKAKTDSIVLSNPRPFTGFNFIIKEFDLTDEDYKYIVRTDWTKLSFIPITEELTQIALQQDVNALRLLFDKRFTVDAEVVMDCLDKNPQLFLSMLNQERLGRLDITDEMKFIAIDGDPNLIRFFAKESNLEMRMAAVRQNGFCLRYILKYDPHPDIIDAAIDQNGACIVLLKSASYEQKKRALESNPVAYIFLSAVDRMNPEFKKSEIYNGTRIYGS